MQTTTNNNVSTFQLWNEGKISGFGSFHTTLLKAYQLADEGNREALKNAFPDWFMTKEEQIAAQEDAAETAFLKSHPELNP